MLVQFSDAKVHIKDLHYGVVVELIYNSGVRSFGHIEGFTSNNLGELLLTINVNGVHKYIHPANLIFNIKE